MKIKIWSAERPPEGVIPGFNSPELEVTALKFEGGQVTRVALTLPDGVPSSLELAYRASFDLTDIPAAAVPAAVPAVTVGDVLAQIPGGCGTTRAFLTEMVSQKSTGLHTPLASVFAYGDLRSLPAGVSRERLASAIAEAYLLNEENL